MSSEPSTPVGSYSITVMGTGASASHATTISLAVNAPVSDDFSISASPSSVTTLQGQSATSTISTAVVSGSAQTVTLSASGLPAGATATFNPSRVEARRGANVTMTTASSTPVGSYSITVMGTGASASHATPISLAVNAPVSDDFSISASPSSVTTLQGQSATSTISTAVVSGSAQTVTLSASGLPAGATATFNPTAVTAGGSSTLTMATASSTPVGNYSRTVKGPGGSASHASTIPLAVNAPVSDDFSISASPSSVTTLQGQSVTSSITTALVSGSAQTVTLSASGLPAGATATFSPSAVTAGGSSTLTMTTASSTPVGNYSITVTGTGTSRAPARTISQAVNAPVSDDFSINASPSSMSAIRGQSAPTTISTAVVSGSAQTVTLSAGGLPAGATATFNPTAVTAGGSSTLTMTTASSTPVGDYSITVTGTGASASHATTISLAVNAPVSDDDWMSTRLSTVTTLQAQTVTCS